jgi:hypothetical protein
VAAPGIAIKPLRQPGTHGVSVDVPDQFEQVPVGINENRLVAAAKQGPVAVVIPVEPLRVDTINVAHASRDIRLRCLQQKVIVIRHEAVGGNTDIPGLRGLLEKIDKQDVIAPATENRLPAPAAVHCVVPPILACYPERPRHV